MLKNYFTIALRNIRKHVFYSTINIAGLAVAVAACLFVLLYVTDELRYDRFHAKADVINREFIINLGISSVLGGVAGYFLADILMDSIWEYYLKLTVTTLLMSVLAMVILAVLAVGSKTLKTAALNPVNTLRTE